MFELGDRGVWVCDEDDENDAECRGGDGNNVDG